MRAGRGGAAVRAEVRRDLEQLLQQTGPGQPRPEGLLVLVACSGGPDSLALAAATAFVAPRLGLRAGAVVVDHGLQPGSSAVAATAAACCRELGLDPVLLTAVTVAPAGGDGPEAAARTARYDALDRAATETGATAVLLGHTADDQAESVLLGLLRGSGARSLGGMPRHRGPYRRPLLAIDRATTAAACAEAGLEPWHDPHNADPAYARARARALLAELEGRLGPGVRRGLARSATLLRADDEALSAWAAREYAGRPDREEGLDCRWLAGLPTAVRTRVIVLASQAAGVRIADLGEVHVAALDAMVSDWHGQGPVDLPGPVSARRDCGRLLLAQPEQPEE